MKILIVDDSLDQRYILKTFLHTEMNEVYEASSGQEGLRLTEKYHFDIILSDIEMPNGSGLWFLEKVRQTERTPFVLLSANCFLGAEIKELGATAFIPKPFRMDSLYGVLNSVLGRKVFSKDETQKGPS